MINRIKQYLDLKKILTAVLFIVAGYTVTVLNNAAQAHEAGLRAEKILVGNGEPGVLSLLKEIKDEVADIKQMQRTLERKEFFVYNALADVGTMGATVPFVMINELGLAQVYRGETHMKVTNTSSPDKETHEFLIQGSFRNDDPTHAIKLSRRAGSMLGVLSDEIHVEIAPVDK